MTNKEALGMALSSLRAEAYAGHNARLMAAEAAHPEGLMLTCDMCPCGVSTGAYSDEKCKALMVLQGVKFSEG